MRSIHLKGYRIQALFFTSGHIRMLTDMAADIQLRQLHRVRTQSEMGMCRKMHKLFNKPRKNSIIFCMFLYIMMHRSKDRL